MGEGRRLAAEAAKFVTVGGVATTVALVVFNLLVHGIIVTGPGPMHDYPLPALVLANAVGMVVGYTGDRAWTFRHRRVVGPWGGVPAFVGINLLSHLVPLTLLAFSRYVLGLDDPVSDNVSANVLGLGLGALVRFWAYRRFVFLRHDAVGGVEQTKRSTVPVSVQSLRRRIATAIVRQTGRQTIDTSSESSASRTSLGGTRRP